MWSSIYNKIFLAFLCGSFPILNGSKYDLTVDTDEVKNVVHDFFLSFCIDSFMFDPSVRWHNFNFSSLKLHTLLKSMSPTILRIGGGPADYLFFDVPQDDLNSSDIKPDPIVMTKQDVVNLIELTRATNSRLLFDFNVQVRYGYQWDPSNAIKFLEFCHQNNYGENIDFELGNEPDYLLPDLITPKNLGRDFQILHKIVRHYSSFNKSSIVGPDVVSVSKLALDYISSVVDNCGNFLKAVTFHHYYFRGDTASYKEYLKAEYFDDLVHHTDAVKKEISKSKYPSMDIWLGETSDAWHSGTVNVSDRFVSGFLWLEKLGLSALMGVKVIMRQTLFGFNYALLDQKLDPNPDFWLSWLHKSFVGRTVFQVNLSHYYGYNKTESFRVYAHCTRPSSQYSAGSLTLFALNIDTTQIMLVSFGGPLKEQPFHVYLVQPGDADTDADSIPILSKQCKVNGKLMKMPSETSMPDLIPLEHDPGQPIILPPLTYMFIVFHKSHIKACLQE